MLDALSNFKRLLIDVPRLNQSNAAALCGISTGRMSEYMSGKAAVSVEDSEKLDGFCRFVRDIEAAFSPVPVDWKNTSAIKRLKAGFENETLTTCVIDLAESEPKQRR